MLAKRFPYAVYYRVLGQQYQVNIIRVLDCRQDPQTTRRSLS
jgi:plasmid stabilization system protein ParE